MNTGLDCGSNHINNYQLKLPQFQLNGEGVYTKGIIRRNQVKWIISSYYVTPNQVTKDKTSIKEWNHKIESKKSKIIG